MAKLYKYPKGGAFYDAFGGKDWGTEEVEFGGDSFNRDATNCCLTSADADSGELSFTSDNCSINPDAFAPALDSKVYAVGRGLDQPINLTFCSDGLKFTEQTNTVKEQLREMQKQIDELKKGYCATSKLRSALKTLQYKREVE